MAVAVQELDGYPGRPPKDLRAFMRSSDALSTWVAEYDGAIAGEVTLAFDDGAELQSYVFVGPV